MELKLSAQKRNIKEKTGLEDIAAVVYGKGLKSQAIKLNRAEFVKIFTSSGESNLIELDLEGKKINVLIKEVQKNPIKDQFIHVDLYQVNMKDRIHTEIPLHFIGESRAIKELGGILIKEINEIKVECLPGDLVDHIDVDISVLETMNDVIKISNLNIPKNIEILLDPDTIVTMVSEPKVQEEEPIAEEVVAEGAEGEEKSTAEGENTDDKGDEKEKEERKNK
jgi:large subunit ribosomal protein L25